MVQVASLIPSPLWTCALSSPVVWKAHWLLIQGIHELHVHVRVMTDRDLLQYQPGEENNLSFHDNHVMCIPRDNIHVAAWRARGRGEMSVYDPDEVVIPNKLWMGDVRDTWNRLDHTVAVLHL